MWFYASEKFKQSAKNTDIMLLVPANNSKWNVSFKLFG